MTAPAAMPSVEDVARALCKAQHYDPDFDYDPHGIYDQPGSNVRWKLYHGQALAILALFEKHFAPILAEKEREIDGLLVRHEGDLAFASSRILEAEARALAAEAALAAERERCAKVAEADSPGAGSRIAAAIRTQGA